MGAVYEAVNESIERRVAIKVLRSEYAHQPEIVTRFFNEARAVNRISHPSIVQIQEHGYLPDRTAFIVMELLEGETLAQRLRRTQGLMSQQQVLQIAWQIAAALAAAHDKNIIHRDLKPSNLMLVPDPLGPGGERVKVLDFGIAKLIADTQQGKTASHVVMGTPTYMSPEQCRGAGSVDAKTDVYSLGVIIYELLVGQPPFAAEGAGELIGMHLFRPAPLLRDINAGVPLHVAQFVHSLLSKERSERPSMAEAAKYLSQLAAPNDRYAVPTSGGKAGAPPAASVVPRPSLETVRVDDVRTAPLRARRGTLFVRILVGGALVALVAVGSRSVWRHGMEPDNSGVSAVARVRPAPVGKPASSMPDAVPQASQAEQPAPMDAARPSSQPEVATEKGVGSLPGPYKPQAADARALRSNSAATAASPPQPAAGGPSVDELLKRAESHLLAGRWADALNIALAPRMPKPPSTPAWRIIGAASCHLGDAATAKAAYEALDTANRQWLFTACEKTSVGLPPLAATAPVPAKPVPKPQIPTVDEKARTAYRVAQANYQRGTYGVALVAAEQAAEGGVVEAWNLLGLLACQLRDLPKLEAAYARATPTGQQQIGSLCRSLQIPIPPAHRAK